MADRALRRLRFSRSIIEDVGQLIRHHLFEVDSIAQNDAAIRRLIRRVGSDRIEGLLQLRRADIEACGPGRRPSPAFAELEDRIEKIQTRENPIDVKSLKINGRDVMRWLKIPPGPRVGELLQNLVEWVIEDPARNRRSVLKKKIAPDPVNG